MNARHAARAKNVISDRRPDRGAALHELQKKLEEGLTAARLTKSQLAGLAGLGRTTVSQAFNSTVKAPTAQTLRELSRVLHLELRPLLDLRDAADGATLSRPGRQSYGSAVVMRNAGRPVAAGAPPEPQASPAAPPRWPRVADTSPLDAGLAVTGAGDVPAYVERDIDGAVRERIRAADRAGGTLLIVGDSAAGKTRTLYEAMRAQLPRHRFMRPAHPADFPSLAAGIVACADPCVLWLDELDRYLDDGCGLTAHGLAELRRTQAVVLTTLNASTYERWNDAEVVRQMQPVVLDRRWNPAERRRAAESKDPRVVRAAELSPPDIGITEYLAADPWLWQELRLADRAGGRPRGAALTRAGIDLARAGISSPLPTSLLLEAHAPYLVESGGPLLRPEPVDDALAWAGRTRHGVSSMLLPVGEDVWRAHPQLVVAADEGGVPVHWLTWFQAFSAADSLDEIFAVVLNAGRHAPSIAVHLWRALADAGIKEAANNLGVTLATLGRYEEAEQVYRTADSEDALVLLNLGNLLWTTGRREEAVEAYRKSGERGEANAWNNLGLLFKKQGEFSRAEVCLRSAALAGAPDAEYNLGVLLQELGRTEEAKAAYACAHRAGDSAGLTNWGMLLLEEGHREEAESLLRQAADVGDQDAMLTLANTAKAEGDLRQATDWYHRAIQAGDTRAYFNLANLLRDNGQLSLAELLYRQAIAAGVTSTVYNLALLLMRQERLTEAETFLRQAAAHGHRKAMFYLGYVLRQTGQPEAAAEQWESAAEEGDTDAAIALATVLTSPSDQARLHRVLGRAADAGDGDAALVLSAMTSYETGHDLGSTRHRS
ncbi:tetratricopeptide repeat protein [Streptomyces klenkii]|uniref:tetratricopeptide repeat protein n=1 Tax=Streptomyces klenkii TaxID=1420899 RepID=UPI0033AFB75B